jgi:hypothetical protein
LPADSEEGVAPPDRKLHPWTAPVSPVSWFAAIFEGQREKSAGEKKRKEGEARRKKWGKWGTTGPLIEN